VPATGAASACSLVRCVALTTSSVSPLALRSASTSSADQVRRYSAAICARVWTMAASAASDSWYLLRWTSISFCPSVSACRISR
jgi:hypothetical protein